MAADGVNKQILHSNEIEGLLMRTLDDSDFSDLEDSGDEWDEVNDVLEYQPQNDHLQAVDNEPPEAETDAVPANRIRGNIWKIGEMENKLGDISVHEELAADSDFPKTTKDAFFEYLDLDFFSEIAQQTNLYYAQKHDLKSLNVSLSEIIRFIRVEIAMGCLRLPQGRLYWSNELRMPLIADNMSRDRYFSIRNALHFVNNLEENDRGNDKLWKVRPIVNKVRKVCLDLPRTKHLSIDEQMIPFAGRCSMRQYVPSKPNPLGLKNFVLAASDGLVLDFCVYVGQGTVTDADKKELGVGASIVKLLCQTVPKNEHHVIYTDRFFTSIKCVELLLNEGVYQIGTVNKNRSGPGFKKLPEDKIMKRGDHKSVINEQKNVGLTKWMDNKSVLLLSSCIGSEPSSTCRRWSKEHKCKVDVEQPAVVKLYNKNMGGIDLCDRMLAHYRSKVRTKRWPVRFFNHLVDLIIVNCWIMYKRACKTAGVMKKDEMSLLQYRLRLAGILVKTDLPREIRERTSAQILTPSLVADDEGPSKGKQRKVVPAPLPEIRFDNIGHLPEFQNDPSASKCRYPNCKSHSRVKCVKCQMYLCVLANNCFVKYHTK